MNSTSLLYLVTEILSATTCGLHVIQHSMNKLNNKIIKCKTPGGENTKINLIEYN